ncbi:shikimate dehydrogenase (NADP(+)) [Campylobacterota bacterium]|nr:shikimate dehydrogenase (NADP(+)) [Campylobacterota bacterium]
MKLLAVLGNPIAHSKSPLMHNALYDRLGIDAIYTRRLIANGERLREDFDALGVAAANITVPFKEFAFAQADEVRGDAAAIGAVNTWVREDGRLIGYNTDSAGFWQAIAHFDTPTNALILGAGGTARAVAVGFAKARENGQVRGECIVLNRSADRLAFFADRGIKTASWDHLIDQPFDLIINTTSAGLKSDDLPLEVAALSRYLAAARYAVDVIYGRETPFLRLAHEMGKTVQDGEAMLVAQGALAHKLFFPDTSADFAAIARIMQTALRLPTQWR